MKIVTVGDNCIDYYENEKKGYPGGNPVNVAIYIKRLGYLASYVGVVGNDDFGKVMLDSINAKGVDTSFVEKKEGNTAMTMVTFNGNDRILGDYFEGVLEDFKLSQKQIDYINTFDLMVTGIWSKVEDDLEAIHIPIAFDFADKYGTELFYQSINKVEYAFFSDDIRTNEELKEILKQLFKGINKMIVITRGEKGSIAYDGKQFYEEGIIPCKVVDTLGAGDSYIAGFLVSYLQYHDIQKAMHEGSINANITIQYKGAW